MAIPWTNDPPPPPKPERVSDFLAGLVAAGICLALLLMFAAAYDAQERAADRLAQPGIEKLREFATER